VKGVSKRYNIHKNPDSLSAFKYVNTSSTTNEKALHMRAALLENKEGFINGRETSKPNDAKVKLTFEDYHNKV